MQSFPDGFRAVVLGASGALGAALVEQLRADARAPEVIALSRTSEPAFDLADEGSIAEAAQSVGSLGPCHLVLLATGVLHGPGLAPEKRLLDLDPAALGASFAVNAIGPALVMKHFLPLLDGQRAVFAVLSAKVGSIEDNRLGGWYSYRASKAALNMLLKTASIEVRRKQPRAVLLALHPGTVVSRLSQPFQGGSKARPAVDAAADLLKVIDGSTPEDSGRFMSYAGEPLPW